MRIIDLIQKTNWAIIPEKLDAIHQVLFNRLHGRPIDLTEFEMHDRIQAGEQLENSYDVTVTPDGIAIIPVIGVLAKRMNLFMEISGGTSTEILARDFRLAINDSDVKGILLDIDSPGGTVDGTEALADLIYESRGIKPITAFANGMAASAAYWIASAADEIITEATGEVGSIGVVMIHYDYSRADEMQGVKRSMIYAGKYKTMGNNAEALTRESRDYLQAGVDYLYKQFVDTVARNRGVNIDTVLEDMAEGRLFIGQQAVDAGLVDSLGSFEMAYDLVLAKCKKKKWSLNNINFGIKSLKGKESQPMLKKTIKAEDAHVTLELLQAEYPDLVEQIRQEGIASINITDLEINAAHKERGRILDLVMAQFGEKAGNSFKAIVETGITVDQLKAIQGIQPAGEAKDIKEDLLKAINDAGAENPGAGNMTQAGDGQDFMAKVEAYKIQTGCKKSDAIQAIMKQDPAGHEAWIKSKQHVLH